MTMQDNFDTMFAFTIEKGISEMTTTLSIRMDSDLKEEAKEFFEDIGMDITTAITCFVKKCLDLGEIPFKLGRARHSPNAVTLAAMEEGDRIVNDPDVKAYSLEEALAELKK